MLAGLALPALPQFALVCATTLAQEPQKTMAEPAAQSSCPSLAAALLCHAALLCALLCLQRQLQRAHHKPSRAGLM